MAREKTPEEIRQKREIATAQHREWRRANPDKQKAIMDRFYAKKARAMGIAFAEDIESIRSEIANGQ